ncbi:MAG TPA: spermidine/putrescine ABC transporter substrate-binding protein [Opitutaceae bacterium]|nr:spermidine/putrescine ABC transporter substrate-binding protein [Opitutaceae bacterium]
MPSSPKPPVTASAWTRRQWLAAAAAGLAAAGCDRLPKFSLRHTLKIKGEIHVLIWDNYISQEILDGFLAATGIKAVFHIFSSNDALADLLRARAAPYDLVMPSSFEGARLRELGLLKTFKAANLPNLANMDGLTFNPKFDPRNQYLVPYIWGATGIGYNAGRVNGLPKSWADLFAYQLRPDGTSVGVSVLDDARFTLGTVLLYLKKSPNSASAEDVEQAGEVLKRLRSHITYFESDNVAKLLADNSVDLAMAWTGDVTRAMLGDRDDNIPSNKKVRISLPREGSIIFRDCFAIPRAAENQADAETFVNYLLSPKVAADVTNYSLYATTVPKSRPLVDRFILNGPSFFEHPEGGRNNFTLDDVIAIDDVYQRVWREVKSAPPPAPSLQVPGAPATPAPAAPPPPAAPTTG